MKMKSMLMGMLALGCACAFGGEAVVAQKLQTCDFLLNKDYKKDAKVYLCLFSASWCGPCRAEMPRIAKTYAETLKDDPDIELIHFSRDQDDDKAMTWAKEHDVKFPVVKPKGGNPLNFQPHGIPCLYIVKRDGTVVEEGHPSRAFNLSKISNALATSGEESVDGYTWSYWVRNGEATIAPLNGKYVAVSPSLQGHVVIPSKLGNARVTSIGVRALSLNRGLTSLTIPEGVKRIENHAFSSCSGLSTVSFPTSLTVIEDQAFTECTALESLSLPVRLKSVGSMAFWRCSNLQSVTIPAGVTSIGGIAFSECKKLRSVTIPATVADLGHGAFSECCELKEINVENGNEKYVSVDGVLYTKDMGAFVMCPGGVKFVRVPASVKSIWRYAFQGCDKLEKIVVDDGNQTYVSVDGFLLTKDRKTLVACPGALPDLKLPSSLTRIESEACARNENVVSVEIAEGVVSIGRWAFNGCSRLKSVKIPTSVVTMESGVFERCPGLTSMTIPPNVRHLGGWTFDGCKGLRSVTLSEGLENIGDYEFWSCTGLTSLAIPASVKRIGRHAFIGCRELTSLTMCGERPSTKDDNAFQDCKRLSAIYVSPKAKSWAGMTKWLGIPLVFGEQKGESKSDRTTKSNETVAEKLQTCDFLLNKDFKKNAKYYLCLFSASWCGPCRREMPRLAKFYVDALKTDPDIELVHFSRDQNDEKALAWAKEQSVKFPVVKPKGGNPLDLHSRGIPHLFIVKADGTLVEEGHPAKLFTEEKLRALKTGKTVSSAKPKDANGECFEKVGGYTWTYRVIGGAAMIVATNRARRCTISPCPKGDVTIPSALGGAKVTTIWIEAFGECSELTSVTIPDSVTRFGDRAFSKCCGLRSVTFGSGVTDIGRVPFFGCSGLTSVSVSEANERYASLDGVLFNKNRETLIFFPGGKTGEYVIPPTVKNIGEFAFGACNKLTVVIPSSVKSIGDMAFSGSALKAVTISEGVTSIGSGVFCLCPELKAITLPSSVTNMDRMVFYGCKELSSVTMRGERPNAPDDVFKKCDKLVAIHVPANAKSWAGMKEWQGIPLVFDEKAE